MQKSASLVAIVLAIVVVAGILVSGINRPVSAVVLTGVVGRLNLPSTLIIRATLIRPPITTPVPTRRIILTRIIPVTLIFSTPPTTAPTTKPTQPAPTVPPTTKPTLAPTTAHNTNPTTVPPTFTPTRVPVRPTQAGGPAVPSTSQACLTDKALAYVKNSGTPARTDIVLRLLDSGSETIPTANMPGTSQHPRWSDDGCALYFAYRKPDAGEKYHIWMLKGAQITQVSSSATDDIWLMKNAQVTQLTASPNDDEVDPDSARGSKVVFVGESGHLKILDTLSPQNITDLGVEGHQPSVSPDGNWVLYVDTKGELSALSIQNGKHISLGRPAQNPRWDPSGKGGYFTAAQQDGSLALYEFTFSSNPPDLAVNPIDPASLDAAIDPDGTGQAVLVSGPLGKEQLELVPAINPLGQKTSITQSAAGSTDATTSYAPDFFSPTHATPDMQAANAYLTSAAQGGQ